MNKKELKKLQKEALDHYDRMIKWVEEEELNPLNPSDFHIMKACTNENWYGEYCSYCREVRSDCNKCILNDSEYADEWHRNCCSTLWYKMNEAKTWKTWLKYAKLVREYIKENGM